MKPEPPIDYSGWPFGVDARLMGTTESVKVDPADVERLLQIKVRPEDIVWTEGRKFTREEMDIFFKPFPRPQP